MFICLLNCFMNFEFLQALVLVEWGCFCYFVSSYGCVVHFMRTQPLTPLTLQDVGDAILLYALPYAGFSNLTAFRLPMGEDFSRVYYGSAGFAYLGAWCCFWQIWRICRAKKERAKVLKDEN
jgi:hypothetical protein